MESADPGILTRLWRAHVAWGLVLCVAWCLLPMTPFGSALTPPGLAVWCLWACGVLWHGIAITRDLPQETREDYLRTRLALSIGACTLTSIAALFAYPLLYWAGKSMLG